MKLSKIYNENCLDTMARIPDNFIDLTITSPPYDNLRTYENQNHFNFPGFIFTLFNIAYGISQVYV